MNNDIAELVGALNRIRAQLGEMGQTLAWIGLGVVASAIVFGCDPAKDEAALVDACMSENSKARIEPSHHVSFGMTCMSSKGYDFAWEQESCANLTYSAYSGGCYDKRGFWRSTKLAVRSAVGWMQKKEKT